MNIKRKNYSSKLSFAIESLTRPMFKKNGFVDSRIITDWSDIVGEKLAKLCTPQKITSTGVLQINVYDSGIALELAYLEKNIIDKIAIYFGYKIIKKISLNRKYYDAPKIEAMQPIKAAIPPAIITDALAGIEDRQLQSTISELAGYIYR